MKKIHLKNKLLIEFIAVLLVLNISTLVLLLYFLYGKTDNSAAGIRNQEKIGACYMTMNNPFYSILNNEVRAVVEEKGDILITRNPGLDSVKQQEEIYDLIDLGVKALIITPVDWKAIEPALRKAKGQGIAIVIVDSNVYDDELVDCTVVSDNYEAGVQCAEELMKQQESARIVVLKHSVAKSSIDRTAGFEETLKKNPNYTIVERVECNGQLEVAMPAMEKVLDTGVAFDTIFALNDPSALGAMAALEEKNCLEGIEVYSVDGSPEGKAMVKEGMMEATSAQFPTEIGRMAAERMYDILTGKMVETEILVPVTLVTSENIGDYEIDRWQ